MIAARRRITGSGDSIMTVVRLIEDNDTLVSAVETFIHAMFGLSGGTASLDNWVERFVEPGRVFGAWVEDELAGTTNSYTGEITLPGGGGVSAMQL